MGIPRFLYRGVHDQMHESGLGLTPKSLEAPFKQPVYYGDSGDPNRNTYYRDGSTYGASQANAVVKHQRDSAKNPTSGVSTTPSKENAKQYALHASSSGYVYEIDTQLLSEHKVSFFEVKKFATKPAIPGDEEFVLVAADFRELPGGIVVDVFRVAA